MISSITRIVTLTLLASEAASFAPVQTIISRRRSIVQVSAVDTTTAISSIDAFYQNEPYVAAFLTCSVKASAADWVTQVKSSASNFFEKSKEGDDEDSIDLRRNLAFWLYGGIYQGMCQQYLYGTLFPSLFGDGPITLASVATQVFIDIAFISPLVCLPVAYVVKASVAKGETLGDGLQKYKDHVLGEGLLLKYASLWIPVQFLTFGVIPQHLRIVFIAAVSFFWLMILSSVSATETATKAETRST